MWKYLPILREFEEEWYPAKDVPRLVDFIGWLEAKGYKIIKPKEEKDVDT